MQRKLGLRAAWKVGAGLAVAALVLAACGSTPQAVTTSTAAGATTTAPSIIPKGGTVEWAEGAAVKPDWIFPFASLAYFSVANLTQFQYLMYRPLYWFGSPSSTAPDVDYTLSPANAPVWSNGDKTVTISLKGWKFRDGQVVDAQSVVFWLNMMKAEGTNWAGYVSGSQAFPGNIKSYSAASASALSVTINLTESFSTNWYLYNELSQISPMAEAWDVTSLTAKAGSGGCGAVASGAMTGSATTAACTKVWTFDTDNGGKATNAAMSADIDTYSTNPLWADGVDGPWYLSNFNGASGEATFSPNAKYSGTQHPYISKFIEVPYTSTAAEFNALAAGGTNAPQVGYLPSEDTPAKPLSDANSPLVSGPNAPQLAANYNLTVAPTWTINYFPENFDSTLGAGGHAGAVFSQLYFRQALQELINETGIIQTYFKGYGVPTYGPAPVYPTNNFAAGVELKPGGPYPFSEASAIALLKANGWTVKPGGISTCAKAGSAKGDCGAGIPAGTPLTFSEVYVSGTPVLQETVQYEVSEWSKAGIQVKTKQNTFDGVLGVAVPCIPKKTAACQDWDMANWGGGWLYAPDYLPTGEEIFATGAGSNSGNYNNTENNTLIVETNRSSSQSIFLKWENYLAEQLPVIWQPDTVGEVEIAKNLEGVLPVNALDNLTPEYWYLKTS
jgi:peptide/nickel transport system substrate-binding protein